MKHVLAVVAAALAVSLVWVPMTSAQTKWVRGNVVSVAGDTLVVKAEGRDWTFKVDKSTVLTARGAGRRRRKPRRRARRSQVRGLREARVGVEVHYKDVGGVLMATDVHSGLPPTEGSAPAETAGGSARGTIAALGPASVTLKAEDKDWVFSVDSKTLVLGEGMGTITRQFKDQGKMPAITDLLGVNDQVVVYFKSGADAKRATEIRVMKKAK